MRKFFSTLILFLGSILIAEAQYFSYLATNASINSSNTYTDLGTTGSKITTNFSGAAMGNVDDNSSVQQIGFTFNFSGVNFTTFVLNTNGFIRLGNQPTAISESHDVLFSTDPSATNVIYPFNINLQATGNTEFRVLTSGTVGSRVCTIQYKALTDSGCPVNCSPASLIQYDNIDFQIKLYEGTNNIEFVYGTYIANGNPSGFVPTNCGLKLSDPSRSVNATKASTTAYSSLTFIDGAYTGNRFNTRNSLLPSAGFTLQFVPINVLNNNVKIQTVYTMGKLPQNYDHADSVIIQNIGQTNLTNYPVTLTISGANSFIYQQIIPTLNAGDKSVVIFPIMHSTNTGINTAIISLPNDDDNTDNTDTTHELITALTIGTCYDTTIGGSLGQTTNTIDLAIRFKNPSTTNKITSVTAYFSAAGQGFSAKIYSVSGDTPKAQIYAFPTKVCTAGQNVLTPTAPISVTGDFFLILTQPSSTASFGAGFQRETPIRSKTFFFRSPALKTSPWNDFAPLNSFRLMADVTMQTAFLPVKLISFKGFKEDKHNVLTWQTSNEVNNLGFEIQRSNNGNDFVNIGFEKSTSLINSINNYSFIDAAPLNGNNYYRLRQLDKDGKASFSEIVIIKNSTIEKSEIISIYPNPTAENIRLTLNIINNEKITVQVTDIYGKTIKQEIYQAQQGNNKINIGSASFAAGTYFVKVLSQSNEIIATTKFVKL